MASKLVAASAVEVCATSPTDEEVGVYGNGNCVYTAHSPEKRQSPESALPSKKRRKQSYPVRISTTSSNEPPAAVTTKAPSPEPQEPLPALTAPPQPESEPDPGPEPGQEPGLEPHVAPSHWIPPEHQQHQDELYRAGLQVFPPAFRVIADLARPPVRQPLRIFNPDAFCNLCNKEFCNKYFLKTHKANKHGVYSDMPAGEMALAAMYADSFLAPNFKLPPMQEQPPTPTPTTPAPSLPPLTKPRAIGPLHTCDICLKKVTNVRRHKAKTHGITFDDSPSMDGDNTSGRLMCENTSGRLSGDNSSGRLLGDNSSGRLVGDNTSGRLSGDNSSGRLVGDNSSGRLPSVGDTETTPASPASRTQSSVDCEDDSYLMDVGSSTPGKLTNPLRRLRIVNSEAFCDICCKEYCNKYFLRTHKMKRHGIPFFDDNQKENRPEEGNMSNGHCAQSSPLNLMMSGQNTNSSAEYYADNVKSESAPEEELLCKLCRASVRISQTMTHFEVAHPDWYYPPSPTMLGLLSEPPARSPSPENVESTTDVVNDDLQKLQTMISQLNELKNNVIRCQVCGIDLASSQHLQAHMISNHGELLTAATSPGEVTSEVPTSQDSGGDGVSVAASVGGETSPMPPTKEERRSNSANLHGEPISSYCTICNKELCNKYFMRTHMQRMHGIELRNGVHIGGVVCNICNKELCSKYFLRVHKQNTHGIVEDGVPLPTPSTQIQVGSEETSNIQEPVPVLTPGPAAIVGGSAGPGPGSGSGPVADEPPQPDTALKSVDLADLTNRYFAHFTEVCPLCSRRFRSAKWLKTHLLADHGRAGHDKCEEMDKAEVPSVCQAPPPPPVNPPPPPPPPLLKIPQQSQQNADSTNSVAANIFGEYTKKYYCSFCNFSSPVLAFLFMHERSHATSGAVAGRTVAVEGGDPYRLQSFVLEEATGGRFVPALVLLPVRELLSVPETVSFTLTPTPVGGGDQRNHV